MTSKVWFPERWPPLRPDVLQLYSLATPNGQKVSVCLEEMGLDYEAHLINILQGDQQGPDYVKLSPNGKIPSILDPNGPGGTPIILCESIVILTYLADKNGMLLPRDYAARMDHLQWLVFQAAHIGPMFGQFGHFYKFARDKTSDEYAVKRYTDETRRLLKVMDDRLAGREYIMTDYSIVDIAMVPWVDCLDGFYEAGAVLEFNTFKNVVAWRKRVTERPAYVEGRRVCSL